MDLLAVELGVDPAELRRRNLLRSDQFPYTTPAGATYDTGAHVEALDEALRVAGYEALRTEQQQRRARGDRHIPRGQAVAMRRGPLPTRAAWPSVSIRAASRS